MISNAPPRHRLSPLLTCTLRLDPLSLRGNLLGRLCFRRQCSSLQQLQPLPVIFEQRRNRCHRTWKGRPFVARPAIKGIRRALQPVHVLGHPQADFHPQPLDLRDLVERPSPRPQLCRLAAVLFDRSACNGQSSRKCVCAQTTASRNGVSVRTWYSLTGAASKRTGWS